MNNTTFTNIANNIGTPTFVFNIDELIERARSIKEILASTNQNIGFVYSIKANPFLIPYLADEVDMFEVCSPGELQIIKHYNISGAKVIYSGVNKGYEDLSDAIGYGAAVITAESPRHFEIIKSIVAENNAKSDDSDKGDFVHVILRLTSGNQFGMSIEDIEEILKGAPYENIVIEGLHYFAGTQRNNPGPQTKELNKLVGIINRLREEYNLPLEKLEYGPGLPHPYFAADDFTDTLAPIKKISEILGETAKECRLTVEMGRFLASSCGYYLTRIKDLKFSSNQGWCIIDGGLNHVNYYGQMMGMKIPVIRHLRKDENAENEEQLNKDAAIANDEQKASSDTIYSLCGSLCTSNDILVREMPLNNPQIDDVLVFENLGAYSITEGMNLFLSRDMAQVVIVKGDEIIVARDVVNSYKLNCDRVQK